jgi:hypothetical protein
MLELLEPRIAPASVYNYLDVDGDKVRITASKGNLEVDATVILLGGQLETLDLTDPVFQGANITFTVTKVAGGDGFAHVGWINAPGRDLGNVTVKGDLGQIDAGDPNLTTAAIKTLSVRSLGLYGLSTQGGAGDLQSVFEGPVGALKVAGEVRGAMLTIKGKLGSLSTGGSIAPGSDGVGGGIFVTGALGSVSIGGSLQGGSDRGSGIVFATGAIGPVKIAGSLVGADGEVSGSLIGASIGNVSIGKDLSGGAGQNSGTLHSATTLGTVSIGRDLRGGAGESSGHIEAKTIGNLSIAKEFTGGSAQLSGSITGKLGNLSIGGSLTGGSGNRSGVVEASGLGKVKIGGGVYGSSGTSSGGLFSNGAVGNVDIGGSVQGSARQSGLILAAGPMGNITIGGSIIGGGADASGGITAAKIGHVVIRGDLRGGSIASADSAAFTGVLVSPGHIASVTIGKSLISGTDASTGTLGLSGAIASHSIGPVKIGGAIVGNATNPALIVTQGREVKPASGTDLALASLTVKGDVRFAQILAGYIPYNPGFGEPGFVSPVNADASIGAVSVGGDWVASSLVAGAEDKGAKGFGLGDTRQTAANTALTAKIASIAIKGAVQGTTVGGDHFGFVAEQIAKLTIGGKVIALKAGPANDHVPIPGTPDVHLLEVTVAPV